MSNRSIHEIAEEIKVTDSDVVEFLRSVGAEANSTSVVDDKVAAVIKKHFRNKNKSDRSSDSEKRKTRVSKSKEKVSENTSKEDNSPEEETNSDDDKKKKTSRYITTRGTVLVGEGSTEKHHHKHSDEEKRRRRRKKKAESVESTENTDVKEDVDKKTEETVPETIAKSDKTEVENISGKEVVSLEEKSQEVKENQTEIKDSVIEKEKSDKTDKTDKTEEDTQTSKKREDVGGKRPDENKAKVGDKTTTEKSRAKKTDRGKGEERKTARGGRKPDTKFVSRDKKNTGKSDNRRNTGAGRNESEGRKSDGYGRNRRSQGAGSETLVEMPGKDKKSRENRFKNEKKDRNKSRYEDGDSRKNRGGRKNLQHKPALEKPKKKEEKKEEIKIIYVPETITISQLAEKMKMQASALIKKLFLEGKMVTVNTEIDFDSAEEIAMGYDIMCEKEETVDVIEELLREEEEDESLMVKRPPVVCVMGHVDHGKTSLLDAIRETNVISGEAGGITQHIGASVVNVKGRTITFLDTPGHEAFTAMRMRGAQSTDIAILVVAADDGVMPQTVEAINHAKAAGIEIIVAINKIDKPGANIDRVKQGLAEHDLLATDWGGNVEMVPVSAHTREGLDELLETVLLQADILELKANPDREARGIVIEAKLDKGRGPVATVLVQKGTLRIGSHIAAGAFHGHLRAMSDDRGNARETAGPSTPVEILGLNGVPNAGEVFVTTKTASEAKDFANTFIQENKAKLVQKNKFRISLEDLNSQIEAGEVKELDIILKADVQGSVEALRQSLVKLSNDEVEVRVIHGGVGAINESDVILASASNAVIIGFNVAPDVQAEMTAKNENVDIKLYNVIYNAIDDIERAIKGMLEPIYEEQVIGHAEIRQIFKASGIGNIGGSYVLDGVVERGCKIRIKRDNDQIFDGNLGSLKRFQDDVKEVRAGYECGLVFEGFGDIKEGDQVEAYKMVEVERK